jgi:hypothetical protein
MNVTEKKAAIYKELREYHGAINEVAERTEYSRYYVSRVLSQKEGLDNEKIWEAAAEVLLEKRKGEKEAIGRFDTLYREVFSIAL